MRDVEDAGARRARRVLVDDARVVDRHLPAGERDEARARLRRGGRTAACAGAAVLRHRVRPRSPCQARTKLPRARARSRRAPRRVQRADRHRNANSSRRWVRIISGPSVETVTRTPRLEEGAEDARAPPRRRRARRSAGSRSGRSPARCRCRRSSAVSSRIAGGEDAVADAVGPQVLDDLADLVGEALLAARGSSRRGRRRARAARAARARVREAAAARAAGRRCRRRRRRAARSGWPSRR